MAAEETLSNFTKQIESKFHQMREAARGRYDAEMKAAETFRARKLAALDKLRANPELLEVVEELAAMAPASANNGHPADFEPPAKPAPWPGLRNVVRRLAAAHPKPFSIVDVLKFAESEHGPGHTDHKAIVSELYKMSHGKNPELAVVDAASATKQGTWKATDNLKKETDIE